MIDPAGVPVAETEPLKPLILLVVQPTPFCNINCSYCYLPDRTVTRRMTPDTLGAIARFLKGVPRVAQPKLSIVWHAGEPLGAPVSFYEEAFTILSSSESPVAVRHHFQTNATLLDDKWCALIKKWGVSVGVSIDGPRRLHDAHRVDRAGRGTFDRVMRGIDKLREHEIPFTVIAVITPEALQAPEETAAFFQSLGARNVGFNIEESEGAHAKSALSGDDHIDQVRAFFRAFLKAQAGDPALRIRELTDMRRHLAAPPESSVLRSGNQPGQIINVDLDGNMTTFSPELLGQSHATYGPFIWGNVHRNSWPELMAHPGLTKARDDIAAGVAACRASCEYFPVCGGGDPSNKLAELGTFRGTETHHCRLHVKAVADVVMEQMEAELNLATV